MAQDYYTLEEAARIVNLSPEDLKQMARRGELRSFQDRGTWRFRVQDIQELARRRGLTSDPELVLGEAPIPRPSDSPAPRSPGPRSPAPRSPSPAKTREAEVFDFSLGGDEDIGVGKEMALDLPPSGGRKSGGGSSGRRPRQEGPRSPARKPQPEPGSDSDVRLVAEGSDVDFKVIDSEARLADDSGAAAGQVKPPSPRRIGPDSPPPRGKPGGKSSSKIDLAPPSSPQPPAPDSGVRLVPMDSDSDVRIVGASSDEADLGTQPPRSAADSDIRVEGQAKGPPPSDAGHLTEEINLDEELRRQEQGKPRQAKVRPKPQKTQAPAPSPFELSEDELNLPADSQVPGVKPDTSDFDLTPAAEKSSPLEPGSSDFELTPAGASPLEPASDEEFHLEVPEDALGLGDPKAGRRPTSGISLEAPADSGISLEQGGDGSDEIEFNISLDATTTPKPSAPQAPGSDSDSEFELTLDSDEGRLTADSDSEFELTLDAEEVRGRKSDSDSEFELTLDDSGSLSPLESPPQVKVGEDKDIFETDFDVPGLEDESGSQAVALEEADTGLESSDFDLQLDGDEESGSAVVALDEEADDSAATVQRKGRLRRTAVVDEEEAGEFAELDEEVAVEEELEEEEEPRRTVVKERLLPAAPWNAWPVFLMLFCVLIMFPVALMGIELAQSVAGYKSPGLITRAVGGILGQNPK